MRNKMTAMVLLALSIGGCIRGERQVSFQRDVQPILQANCIECHTPSAGTGYLETGLTMSTYEELMQGTVYGPVIIPGDSRHSILNMLVEGRTPHQREPLNNEEIEILRLWVEHGALNN